MSKMRYLGPAVVWGALVLTPACHGSFSTGSETTPSSTSSPPSIQPEDRGRKALLLDEGTSQESATRSQGQAISSSSSPDVPVHEEVSSDRQSLPSREPDENERDERCPPDMVFVPGGRFITAVNRRSVEVRDLCVDAHEVTSRKYAECVDASACSTNQVLCSEQATWKKPGKEDHPMVCVDFSQAVDYCAFRHRRLPETAEWEWVARGGELGRKYPWGEEEPDEQLCWQGKRPRAGTCAVGSFPEGASAHGVLDLAGNVHEFTTTAQDTTGIIRIARGGSWKEGDPGMMWPGRIGGFETSYRCSFLGIRCVMEAPNRQGLERDTSEAPSSP